MIYFDKALGQARVELNLDIPDSPPTRKIKYFAYKNGTCTTFDTRAEALGFSAIIEEFLDNKEEIDQYWQNATLINEKAQSIWYKSLREEWKELSEELFAVCYYEACNRGESHGYDSVADYMYSVVDFAKSVIKCKIESFEENV